MSDGASFYWNELMTSDVEAAKAFYKETLGWEFQGMPMESGDTYWMVPGDPMPVCGMFDVAGTPFADMGEQWVAYIAVDDIDARVAKARAAGATIVQEPMDVPEVGRIAMLTQPGGGFIGWMTPS